MHGDNSEILDKHTRQHYNYKDDVWIKLYTTTKPVMSAVTQQRNFIFLIKKSYQYQSITYWMVVF